MSQVLTLASSAVPVPSHSYSADDEEFFSTEVPGMSDPDHSPDCFADEFIDVHFPLLDVNTYSALPCPGIQPVSRKRHIWTNSLHPAKKGAISTPTSLPKDDPYIDVLSDSWSTTSSESDLSSLDSAGTHSPKHRIELFRVKNEHPVRSRCWEKPYHIRQSPLSPSSRDRSLGREREISRVSSDRGHCHKESGKTVINPREEMNSLRLSCTCQTRNTGKNLHLWEFLLEMLADRRMKSVITWTGQEREFRVVNSREVAREWGNRKNKPNMNFDKMSRAMRYYYKKNILTHGNKQRLVYSFGEHAICPHYDKIIKLALRTRPSSQGVGGSQSLPEDDQQETSSSWIPPPVKNTPAFLKVKKESEKMLTERLCPGRKWNVKKPREECFRSCCETLSYKTFQSRSGHNNKLKTGNSNQNKIKITKNTKQLSDCFKFS